MLHYVHQLVANFVCQLFHANQVLYSVFSLPAAAENANETGGLVLVTALYCYSVAISVAERVCTKSTLRMSV